MVVLTAVTLRWTLEGPDAAKFALAADRSA